MKRLYTGVCAVVLLLGQPSFAEPTPDEMEKLKARFARCAENREVGNYCDGFRDGLIYMRENPSLAKAQRIYPGAIMFGQAEAYKVERLETTSTLEEIAEGLDVTSEAAEAISGIEPEAPTRQEFIFVPPASMGGPGEVGAIFPRVQRLAR